MTDYTIHSRNIANENETTCSEDGFRIGFESLYVRAGLTDSITCLKCRDMIEAKMVEQMRLNV